MVGSYEIDQPIYLFSCIFSCIYATELILLINQFDPVRNFFSICVFITTPSLESFYRVMNFRGKPSPVLQHANLFWIDNTKRTV